MSELVDLRGVARILQGFGSDSEEDEVARRAARIVWRRGGSQQECHRRSKQTAELMSVVRIVQRAA